MRENSGYIVAMFYFVPFLHIADHADHRGPNASHIGGGLVRESRTKIGFATCGDVNDRSSVIDSQIFTFIKSAIGPRSKREQSAIGPAFGPRYLVSDFSILSSACNIWSAMVRDLLSKDKIYIKRGRIERIGTVRKGNICRRLKQLARTADQPVQRTVDPVAGARSRLLTKSASCGRRHRELAGRGDHRSSQQGKRNIMTTMKRTILSATAALALLALPALAADPTPQPTPDPRVQAATIDAQQALLRLRETQMLVSTANFQARITALTEKCGDRCADPAAAAQAAPPAATEAPKP